jgi:hypothetical protein
LLPPTTKEPPKAFETLILSDVALGINWSGNILLTKTAEILRKIAKIAALVLLVWRIVEIHLQAHGAHSYKAPGSVLRGSRGIGRDGLRLISREQAIRNRLETDWKRRLKYFYHFRVIEEALPNTGSIG